MPSRHFHRQAAILGSGHRHAGTGTRSDRDGRTDWVMGEFAYFRTRIRHVSADERAELENKFKLTHYPIPPRWGLEVSLSGISQGWAPWALTLRTFSAKKSASSKCASPADYSNIRADHDGYATS